MAKEALELLEARYFGVETFGLGEEFGVASSLDNGPLFEHYDEVGVAQGRDPVGNDHVRPAASVLKEGGEDSILRFGVDRGEGVIEHEDLRIDRQGA